MKLKNKKISLLALLFNLAVAMLLSFATGINPVYTVTTVTALGVFASFVDMPVGILRDGVVKEIWIDVVKEKFYPEASFMNESTNMDEFVDYGVINLAEAGVDPEVLIDNTAYPIPMSTRQDLPIRLPLRVLDTTSTLVHNVEKKQSSYDKMASVTLGHKNALITKSGELAAWNWAAASDGVFTPVLAATGAPDANGRKRLSFEDVITLATRFRNAEIPIDGWNLALNPDHLGDLQIEDIKLYKEVLNGMYLQGFKIHSFTRMPLYNAAGQKQPFGTVQTDELYRGSFAWVKSEVMKCDGDYDMFYRLNDPDYKGDIMNYQKQFLALPFRNKGIGAIYSPKQA